MHRLASWCLALAACLAWSSAQAEVKVEVLEAHPAGEPATIGPRQTYSLRMAYSTTEPVRIWARPWYRGEEVPTATHGSVIYEGSGEAIGWFWLDPGQQVDEVRISAGGVDQPGTGLAATHRVRVVGGSTAVPRADPPWIARLKHEAKDRQASWTARHPPPEPTFLDGILVTVLVWGVLGLAVFSLVAPIVAIRRWRGGWRLAAALPLAIMALVLLNIVVGVAIDPTSHNLWPFELLMAGMACVGIMLALWLARRFLRAGT
ncbi:hypothetical protein ACOPJQ_13030 [Luteimonas dalianensis]|uniref:hypothetical protein n=1 Tax=Luteimonas dalianensis TaxID=1148196 RepID=UPI003BF309AA